MPGYGDVSTGSYAEAFAAFKRVSRENAVIASLLREHFRDVLVAPILDFGAGFRRACRSCVPGSGDLSARSR
jgi:hypothetical protein